MRRRVRLYIEVDLAETGELSTVNHWRLLLQRQLDDFAGAFRPIVRGAINDSASSRMNSPELSHFQAPG